MKPMSGTCKFEHGRWVVRTLNGIEIGSCNGAPTMASALAAVSLSREGSVEVDAWDEEAKALEWTVQAGEVST
jgi:hypothetical protein